MAMDISLGDPSNGLAREIDKLYIGDPLSGLAREVDAMYIGNPNTGLASPCYTSGTRGIYLFGYNKNNNIYYSNTPTGRTPINLPNAKAYSITEFAEYYVIGWDSGSSRGIYYSTDCIEWNSTDITSMGGRISYEPTVHDNKLYIYKDSYTTLETSDCVNFTEISTSSLPWWDCITMEDGTLVKITRSSSGDYYTTYRVSMSKDNGVTWKTSNYSKTLPSTTGIYGAKVDICNGRCIASYEYINFYSSDFRFYCDYNIESRYIDLTGATPEPETNGLILQVIGDHSKHYVDMNVHADKVLTSQQTFLLDNYGITDISNNMIAKTIKGTQGYSTTGTIYMNTNPDSATSESFKNTNAIRMVYSNEEDCVYVVVTDFYNSNSSTNTMRERMYRISKTDSANYSSLSSPIYENTQFPQSIGYIAKFVYKPK